MRHSISQLGRGSMLLRAILTAFLTVLSGGAVAQVITEFSAGITALSGPEQITSRPDGALWFTENFGHQIGHITTSGAAPPVFQSAVSRKVHGGAGTFDLPLANVLTNPTTEPRQSATATIAFTFDKAITGATATVTEGTATASAPTFSGNVSVGLTGVTDQQYVTIALTNVASSDGGTGGSGSVRIGFLVGDVNQNRVVTLADLGLVNQQLAQVVTAANFLKDVNASGTVSLADLGITNANLTKALPPPDPNPSCAAYGGILATVPLVWNQNVNLKSRDYGEFNTNVLIFQLTVPDGTPASFQNGTTGAAEYQGNSTFRQMVISQTPCDFRPVDYTGGNGPLAVSNGTSVSIYLSVGAPSLFGPAALTAGKTYYVSIRNWQLDPTPQGSCPAPQNCSIFFEYHPPQ